MPDAPPTEASGFANEPHQPLALGCPSFDRRYRPVLGRGGELRGDGKKAGRTRTYVVRSATGRMFPSGSLNQAPLTPWISAIPSIVFSPGMSYSSNTTPRS